MSEEWGRSITPFDLGWFRGQKWTWTSWRAEISATTVCLNPVQLPVITYVGIPWWEIHRYALAYFKMLSTIVINFDLSQYVWEVLVAINVRFNFILTGCLSYLACWQFSQSLINIYPLFLKNSVDSALGRFGLNNFFNFVHNLNMHIIPM